MVLRYNSGNKGGIRLSKLNYSYHRFLNNNRNKGIPNLMLWICIGNALVYFLSQFGTPLSLYSALSFDPQAIAHGQVWRLFSYIFTFAGIGDMSIYSIFSVALALYCSYWPARYLEQLWGSLRVNLYYLIGILAMDVYAMLVYFLFHVSYGVSALYLNLSMFLSVAALMPEARGLLFFFIPVKMRWLALVDIGGILYYLVKDILEAVRFWTLYGSAVLGIGLILIAFLPIVAQLPCLLFCWHELPQLLPLSLRRHASRAERKRRAEFRRASAPKQQPNPNWAQNYQNRAGERPYRHKCLVCGRTDTEYRCPRRDRGCRHGCPPEHDCADDSGGTGRKDPLEQCDLPEPFRVGTLCAGAFCAGRDSSESGGSGSKP